jgi:hypothetical protein
MHRIATLLTGLLWAAIAFLLPMAALEPISRASLNASAAASGGLAATACDDGSAHLAMGCASSLL